MGGLKPQPAGVLGEACADALGLLDRQGTACRAAAAQLGGGLLAETKRIVARGCARQRPPRRVPRGGRAIVDDQWFAADAHFERQAAGVRCVRHAERRRRAHVDNHN
jgi:hypothetical protein